MKKNKGFTLLELLIAITISSFILISMIQLFRNVQKMISKNREILHINKSVCLLFNQIERDFNTAIIPQIAPIEKKDEREKKKEKEEKSKEKTKFFIGEINELEDPKKIGDKKLQPFKRFSIVNTNPLQIWGEKGTRLVRVGYELLKNKEKSDKTKIVYDLFRKETLDLRNENFKEQEQTFFSNDKKPAPIKTNIIATNIKFMSIEYISPPDEKEEKSKKEEKKKKDPNVVPQQVEVYISFCGEREKEEKNFSCTIPILSYPTIKDEPKNKKEQKKETKADEKKQNKEKPAIKRR